MTLVHEKSSVIQNRIFFGHGQPIMVEKFDESLRIKCKRKHVSNLRPHRTRVQINVVAINGRGENSTVTTSNGGNEHQPNHARASEPEKLHATPATTINNAAYQEATRHPRSRIARQTLDPNNEVALPR